MFKTIIPLSVIISMRFFGLFVVLPVISIYALSLPGSNGTLVGIVIGGYAITQIIFQVPFGVMSDKLGRKGTIVLGLALFAIGSVVSALATDIYSLLLGRLLQGTGAIGAVIPAMISDSVKEESRSKAMAIMGGSIAMSFALAMLVSPIIASAYGVQALFWITFVLALVSIYMIIFKVPNPPKITHTYHNKDTFAFLINPKINIMNITNLLQKGLMTFAFMIIPIVLVQTYHWELGDLFKVYLPSLIAGIFAMAPAAIFAEKKGYFKQVLIAGIIFFALAFYIIGQQISEIYFVIGIVVFFIGFNIHEPIMQSLVTKYAKVHQRGFVLGVFNSFGYFGTFLGGLLGGIYFDMLTLENITLVILVICFLWVALIAILPNPIKTKILYIALKSVNEDSFSKLDIQNGCDEWYINNTEDIIIIKYQEDLVSAEQIQSIIK